MTTSRAEVFRLRLLGTSAQVRVKATMIVNAITFKLYELIVTAPEHRVDTGRMRMGWAVAVETASDYVPAPVSRETLNARKRSGDRTELFEVPDAQRFASTIIGAPLEAKRIIFNNVEYAVWVELGTVAGGGQHVAKLAVQRLVSGPPSVEEMVA